jgi:DNA-binding CsgD family transcriptional regulator
VDVERGNLEEAERLVGQGVFPDQVTDNLTYCHYLAGRARLLLVQRQWRRALEELLSIGRRLEDCQVTGPARIAWRSQAALAAWGLGDRATATRLSGEELEMAESYGAARPLGMALRAAGLVAGGDEAIVLLERAAQALDGRGIDLEYARVLVELGGLLHRRRAVDDARKRLRVGLDLAVRCGATLLAEQARQDLQATGARPRRNLVTGAGALTAAERRVSQLAADGLTNRDIAQTLFVSVKAVELHLTNSYRKLGIANRAQLGAALATDQRRQT